MKKRILSLLLAVSIACSMLVVPANAAASNAAVQTAVTLGGLTSEQASALSTALTRGQLAKLLVAFSVYRESAATQGNTGTLFTDVDSGNEYAPYLRIAVQQGWLSGYTDGSFRPDNGVTLEEACTAALKLLGYDVTTLSGSFPAAQLNKASALGLRAGLSAVQGQGLTLEDAAVLFYNALTASTAENQTYAATLGFTVTDGRIDLSSVLLSSVEGPFVADGTTQLPFAPAAVYRNDTVATDAALNAYDVYYYSASARTVWIYSRKAAGRITAVSPSASAPTSVTVAGISYTLASSAAASVLSSLNGGGVGQVVTLLLGMNNEAVAVLTGEEADSVFYGVVQTSSRSLTEENGADVLQSVQVACTDGVTRTVNVDKSLNFPTGWLVKMTYLIVPGEDQKVGYRESYQLKYIGDKVVFNPATAVVEVIKELERMASLAEENLNRAMNALITLDEEDIEEVYEVEKNINFLNHAITDYLVKINQTTLPIEDLNSLGALFHVVNDIERIGDHAENVADAARQRKEEGVSISKEAQKELGDMLEMVNKIIRYAVEMFAKSDESHMQEIVTLEDQVDEKERELQKKHVERLTKGECSPEAGMIFSDIVSGLERVADHATNIAFAITTEEDAEDGDIKR